MAISARIPDKKGAPKSGPVSEQEIDALIERGGTPTRVNKQQANEEEPLKPILIKLPQSQADEIDAELRKIPKSRRPSRIAYIAMAVEEKLERDRKKRQ